MIVELSISLPSLAQTKQNSIPQIRFIHTFTDAVSLNALQYKHLWLNCPPIITKHISWLADILCGFNTYSRQEKFPSSYKEHVYHGSRHFFCDGMKGTQTTLSQKQSWSFVQFIYYGSSDNMTKSAGSKIAQTATWTINFGDYRKLCESSC